MDPARSLQIRRQNEHRMLSLDSMDQERGRYPTRSRSARPPLSKRHTCLDLAQGQPQATQDRSRLRTRILHRRTLQYPALFMIRPPSHKGRRKGMWHLHVCLAKRPISGSFSRY